MSGRLHHPNRDPTFRESVAQSQDPFAVILSCIDSRVPPELVFDTGLGDLCVMRTGAQTLGPVVTGSVEYGPVTGATPLIVVLVHQRCGAVAAAYKAIRDSKPLPGNLQAIVDALRPAYQQTVGQGTGRPEADQLETMTKNHARLTADALRTNKDLAPMVGKATLASRQRLLLPGHRSSPGPDRRTILTGLHLPPTAHRPSAATSTPSR